MTRLSIFAVLATLLSAVVVSASQAGPHIIRNSKEIPEGNLRPSDRVLTIDVSSDKIDNSIHEEIPESSTAPDPESTVNITERIQNAVHEEIPEASFAPDTNITVDITERNKQNNFRALKVKELRTSPASLASIPSAKTKLPTSDRVVYGTFIGYARYGTRCYRLRSYVIHARYTPYRGYYCHGRIYYFRNYICVRPVCLARIYYWRY